MERDVLSYCRICAAACGITVTVDGEQVIRVRGDQEHPSSRGYTCSKGRGLAAWHHSPGRLDRPRLAGRDVSWDELLDDLAGALEHAVEAGGGPDAVALYLATGLAYDAAGQVAAATWLGSLGSGSFYTAATVDNAPVLVAAQLVTGHPMLSPVWDPAAAGLLLLVGTNPVVSHGYGTTLPDPVRHLRDHRRAGGRIWVVDPRRTETAALADEHLAGRPGSDVAVLAAVAAALLDSGADDDELARWCAPADLVRLRDALAPFDAQRAADEAGVEVALVEALIAEVRRHRGRLAVMCGTGTTMGRDGLVVEWLRWVVLVLSGSLAREGGMRFHEPVTGRLRPPRRGSGIVAAGPGSRPELGRVVGQQPAVALVDEIEAGHVRALVVTGGNPLAALPEPDRVRAALASLDVLAVVDVAESDLTDLATHVLPATGQLERADVTMASALAVRSSFQATAAVVSPVADRKPVWWMFGSLVRRMGDERAVGPDPDLLSDDDQLRALLGGCSIPVDAVLAAGPRGIDVPVDDAWVRDTMLVDGHWHVAPAEVLARLREHELPPTGSVLAPRREMAWSNSVRYAGSGDEPVVRLHHADAAAAGVGAGDECVVRSAHGTVHATVALDERVRPGTVSVTHGRAARSGALTSSTDDVDPMTGMPLASGVPVTITSPPVLPAAPNR